MLTLHTKNDSIDLGIYADHLIIENFIKPAYKHLQHIPLYFEKHDFAVFSKAEAIDSIDVLGKKAGFDIDLENFKLYNQQYLNYLHKVYENNFYENDSLTHKEWLTFHESIHLLEQLYRHDVDSMLKPNMCIDYRDYAGPVTKKFNIELYRNILENLEDKKGFVTVEWAELGKRPIDYWIDKEPDNFDRIKQLAKPWLYLRPKIIIHTHNKKKTKTFQQDQQEKFNSWWKQYEKEWCNHYGIKKWTFDDQNSCFVIGKLSNENLEKLISWRNNNSYPTCIKLNK